MTESLIDQFACTDPRQIRFPSRSYAAARRGTCHPVAEQDCSGAPVDFVDLMVFCADPRQIRLRFTDGPR